MKEAVTIVLVLYAVERIIETFWKRPKLVGKISAPYSLPLIVVSYVAFYLCILRECFALDEVDLDISTVALGMSMVLASIVGRNWAIRTLGIFHSIHVEIREQHPLIQAGPYRYVRHPYYLSNVIEAFGLVLIVDAGIPVLIALVVYFALLIHRLRFEEGALKNKFQQLFVEYQRDVPLIIPRLGRPVLNDMTVRGMTERN
jgi:protein-S-isoprenylcysteine O-methyltransferase Ste14